ncbi:MAG: transcription-repair coupling factor [Proteobacteria bacterium]|nr:transcription-repair coupling factor [Pseudomonadota bacterium]
MSVSLQEIVRAAEGAEKTMDIDGLHGGSKGLVVASLARRFPSRAIAIITSSPERAHELIDDCAAFIHPDERKRLKLFPDGSALPYSRLSPEPDEWADRLHALYDLAHSVPLIVVAPAAAAMRRVPPKHYITAGARRIRKEESADPYEICAYLARYGYEDVGLVEDEGSFARRGGILDLWPPTSDAPVRLEFEGERIASMRFFDPATQRSKGDAHEILVIPVRDFPFDEPSRAKAAHRVRERSDAADLASHERRALIEAIHEGIAVSGIETLMPLFHESTETLFDYLPGDAMVAIDGPPDVEAAAVEHRREVEELARDTKSPERVIAPDEIVMGLDGFSDSLSRFTALRFNALRMEGQPQSPALNAGTIGNADIRPMIEGHARGEDMLSPLAARIGEWQRAGWRVLLACHTDMQALRLKDLFRWHGVDLAALDAPFEALSEMASHAARLITGRLSAGFRWEAEKLAIITDAEIFGTKAVRRIKASKPMEPFTSFTELAEGDFLVHEHHGIGRYAGLAHLSIEGGEADYLLIEYLGGDRLYLPVYKLGLVGRYIGSGDAPPSLDRLGGARWENMRAKVTREIRLMAKELLAIYAAREVYPGIRFKEGGNEYEEFAAAFPYDETPDQLRSIDDIMADMGLERPMDRLICGDVGYGKTEVAMRAAFRAAMHGAQVAVLVPTTVLALQHYESFTRRFAGTPVAVEMLSRFRSPKEQRKVIEGIKDGRVDILIGTHRLLSKDVAFRQLGLLIIDEEHRFGVRHKERIKKLRQTVDVIAMTATPIPRTLNLSLTGIRDISIINTPPADRLSITTHVAPFDDGIVRQAIIREMARGGQVFFVHNRVETIGSMNERLRKLVPEARIVVGHGQLPEHRLEEVMLAFLKRDADVLLCTTIIESGLDIPSANTIVINRADTFGLAQLYQLRGRVGRSSVRAQAYLLTPPDGRMTTIAKKRLTVLKRFTELGSGFQIAMHDLEFRGAGNILGSAQSGHVAAIGYEMYSKLLDREVRRLTGKAVEDEIDPELNLKVAAFLPEKYVADPGTRIDIYKRLSSRQDEREVEAIGVELADRFGPMPPEAENLLGMMDLRILARNLRIKQVIYDGNQLSCQLDARSPITTEQVLSMVSAFPGRYRVVPPDRLLISAASAGGDSQLIAAAKNSLSEMASYVSENSPEKD